MKLLGSYLKRYKKILGLALLISAVNQIASLADPQLFRIIVDTYATHARELPFGKFFFGVLFLLLVSMGVALIARISKHLRDYYVNVVTQRVGASLYANAVSHSFSLPYAAFEDQRSGELLQKLQKARLDSQGLISNSVNIVFMLVVGVIFVVVYAFFVQWLLGVFYLSVIPVLAISSFIITRRIKTAQQRIVFEMASLAGSTTETMRNVELVKSLGLESQEVNRLNDVNTQILSLELQKVRIMRKLGFVQDTILNTMRSGLLLLMLWFVFRSLVSVGEFFTLFFYTFYVFNPLSDLGQVAGQYQETRASMEVLQQVLDAKPEQKPKNAALLDQLNTIELQNVSFGYTVTERPALQHITFQIERGETVAFVGPSGSGKTTLVKLLLGLYKPSAGVLRLNGIDSTAIDYDFLRKRIGYVSQETQLFAGTLRENLLFVNPNASDKECLQVLEQAAASSIMERSKKGLDTRIGEGGIKISGGERQRLAIARALLRNPDLIIFDEATSSLDSITEKAITATIRDIVKIKPQLITVLIAHRLSTVVHADRICVLEGGKLIEQGDHGKLLNIGGLYAALWREQIGQNI